MENKKEIERIERKIKRLEEYKADLIRTDELSTKIDTTLAGLSLQLNEYEQIERIICSTELGLEFWNNVKKVLYDIPSDSI